jgi:TonB family protein
MNETPEQWAGQIVDGHFLFESYLGGSEGTRVYATRREGEPAAIKLIRANRAEARDHLLRWSRSASLTHPSIVRLFETGRCRIGEEEWVYVVMERADETLAEILPQRQLEPSEVHDMLPPILAGLAFLEAKGLAHGCIKPANILAVGDNVKISGDAICAIGSTRPARAGVYDAPELASQGCSAAADVWSLGAVIVEALTQQRPRWSTSDPILPALMPQPFAEIARNCLRCEPAQRWSISDIALQLQAPGPAPQGRAVPPETATEVRPPFQSVMDRQARPGRQPSALPRWRAFIPAAVLVALAVVVVLTAPRILERLHTRASRPMVEAGPPSTAAANQAAPGGTSAPGSNFASGSPPAPTAPVPAPAASAAKIPTGELADEVIEQAMPNVPESARDTIQGTVRVAILVEVGPSGNVSGATIQSPGPSKYFANLALQSASRWKFAPAAAQDGNADRPWILRFEFRRDGTKVTPTAVPQ